jgi:hypothetical protein
MRPCFLEIVTKLSVPVRLKLGRLLVFLSDEFPQVALKGMDDKQLFMNPFYSYNIDGTSVYDLNGTRYREFNKRFEALLGLPLELCRNSVPCHTNGPRRPSIVVA